jgi:hypothetical protein
MMALEKLATVGLRPQLVWRTALPALLALTAVGCGQHRQSYRPIFATPAAARPCTNCPTGAGVVTEDSSVSPGGAVPVVPEADGTDSSVVPRSGISGGGSGSDSSRGPAGEAAPKSRISDEPGFNELSPASRGNRGSSSSGSPPRPQSAGSGTSQVPNLEAPRSGGSSSNTGGSDGRQTRRPPSGTLRFASQVQRLRPFLDETGANELYYPNKADRPWRYIVLHHSASAAGSYDEIDREHRKILGFDGCGYHFVIGNGSNSDDGRIEVARRWNEQKHGVHCRNARTSDVDEYGIGICLVGDFEQEPPTPRQIAAAQSLIAYLKQRYSISQARVTTHSHLAATPTVCPGRYFPADPIVAGAIDAPSRRLYRMSWTAVADAPR